MPRRIKITSRSKTRLADDYRRPIMMAAVLVGLVGFVFLINIQFQARDEGASKDESRIERGRDVEIAPSDIPLEHPRVRAEKDGSESLMGEGEAKKTSVAPLLDADEQYSAMLAKVKDQRRLGEVKAPYYYVLCKVRSMTNAELDSQMSRSVTYADIAQDPSAVRGRVMRIAGTLMKLKPIRLKKPPPGIATIYEGHIVDSELRHYIIVLTDAPQMRFKVGEDVVRMNGVFFMVKAYKTAGGWWKAAPLVIGKRLIKVKRRETSSMSLTTIMLLVVIAGAAMLTIGRIFWGGRGAASIRSKAAERRMAEELRGDGCDGGEKDARLEWRNDERP